MILAERKKEKNEANTQRAQANIYKKNGLDFLGPAY